LLAANAGASTSNAVIPPASHVQFDSTLDGSDHEVTVRIPVGPATESLGLNLSSLDGSLGGNTPVVGQLTLVDANGSALAVSNTDSGADDTGPQSVTVAMENAPIGGQLLVEIRTSSSQPGTTADAGSSGAAASWIAPFMLDVQRQEELPAASPSVTFTGGQGALGSLVSFASAQGGFAVGPLTATTTTAPSVGFVAEPQAIGEQAPVPASNAATAGGSLDAAVSFNVRLPIGPLAARSAGLLGPDLATAQMDPAPAVDRHERALSQEIDGVSAVDASEAAQSMMLSSAPQVAQTDHHLPAADARTIGEPVATVQGGGGFLLKVTAEGAGQRIDLGGLLANLPDPTAADSTSRAAPGSETESPDDLVPLAMVAPSSWSLDEPEYRNYLRAAFGLALGLGLTSGPLFSDLIASVRTRLPRWRFSAPAGQELDPLGPSSRHLSPTLTTRLWSWIVHRP
jgi:hypothetical protein